MVYIVINPLHGLKRSGREWNSEVNGWVMGYGSTEPCLYFYNRDVAFAMVLPYFDDILCTTKDEEFKKRTFSKLDEDYGLKDQEQLSIYLGVEVKQDQQSIKIHQAQYCEQILDPFGFRDTQSSRIPVEIIQRLTVNDTDNSTTQSSAIRLFIMYLATCTRPDLAYALGQLSRYMQRPTQEHIRAAKRVLRYLVALRIEESHTRKTHHQSKITLLIDGYCDSD
ncbi:hypothetical protein PHPALM_29317 [Phytophthora palmivora]|uniref:Reverse transcriptase Ty1/copia-type domain-containing protein n=1 Tax=Phytophthora palmivora TaxID=4796 RepID=A0A2P4X7X0_9STRA|nr:hypothetical protein PHPALM_29317 [Phytophthora palmivora]